MTHPLPVDPAVLDRLDRIGGPGFAAQLVAIFREESPARVIALAQAVRTRDAGGTGAAAHGLVSSAANLGAGRLAALARAMEQAAAASDWSELERQAAELDREYAAVLKQLLQLRPERSG